jgi:trehalose 6-phosphate phosphatase
MTNSQLSAFAPAPPLPLNLAHNALFLDLDGTLVNLAPTPSEVTADTALTTLLLEIQARTDGAVAVLTGRSLQDADRLLKRSIACVGALHGQHCRAVDKTLRQEPPSEAWDRAKEIIADLVARGALEADIEDKGGAVALHYRAQPEHGPLVARAIEEIASAHGLRALHGKMVSEIMPIGATKGVALSTFMQAPPFAGRTPVAVGDDVTDEDAFAAANALGGVSVLVGQRQNTQARFALPDVAAVRAWLGATL